MQRRFGAQPGARDVPFTDTHLFAWLCARASVHGEHRRVAWPCRSGLRRQTRGCSPRAAAVRCQEPAPRCQTADGASARRSPAQRGVGLCGWGDVRSRWHRISWHQTLVRPCTGGCANRVEEPAACDAEHARPSSLVMPKVPGKDAVLWATGRRQARAGQAGEAGGFQGVFALFARQSL